MIDLSPMKGIHVDVPARTVRAQGGVLWKELNRETQLHGLATTGGVVGSTGIAGLTLGGGLGWLMPKYGLALDNLRAAEMVMADGSVVRASADENPDLFWAIRGGGGNFGIATSLEYTPAPGRADDHRRCRGASAAASARRAAVLPRHLRVAARRDDAGRRPADRAGWIERRSSSALSAATAARSSRARRPSGRSRRSVRP